MQHPDLNIPIIEVADDKIKIRFEYSPAYIEKIKTVPRAHWSPDDRAWVLPFSETALDLVHAVFPHYAHARKTIEKIIKKEIDEVALEELKYLPKVKNLEITDFEFATVPFTHQKISFNFARNLDASALFLEQGLGKAKLAIDLATWRYRQQQIRRALIVCPATVLGQWEDEIAIHGHADFKKYILIEGSGARRQKLLEDMVPEFAGFLLINYEGLLPLREYVLRRQLSAQKLFDMIVLDESSKIKHANSMRSKLTWRIGLTVRYRNIMTGTPITQSIEDIFSQYRFLVPSIFGPYATAFRAQYLIMGGFENRVIKGYKNVQALMKRIYSVAIRFTKDRCLDIPPKVFEKRRVRMDPETTKKYLEFEKKCVAEFEGHTISTSIVVSKIMKLSQIAGGFIYEQGPDGKRVATIDMAKNNKVAALNEIFDEVLPKKLIIWCRFTHELDIISKLLNDKKIKFVSISGRVKRGKDRDAARRTFQTDDSVPVFVGQIAAASHGITLTRAEVVVYYSNSYSYEERIQSEDRVHRAGLDHKVTYIDLIAELHDGRPTIDADVLAIKDGKARLANEVSALLMQRMVTRQGAPMDLFTFSGGDSKTAESFVENEDLL